MIRLLIDDKYVTEVNTYKEAYDLTKHNPGRLEFAVDEEVHELMMIFTSDDEDD